MSSSSLKLVANPLVGHKLARLCDSNTSTTDYPRLLKEITLILGCDATTQDVGESGVGIVPLLKVDSILTSVMLEWLPDALVIDIEGKLDI
jgi:hypothetical protein